MYYIRGKVPDIITDNQVFSFQVACAKALPAPKNKEVPLVF